MKTGKSMLRLAEQCKKVKMNLSMAKETGISIDCLADGEDMEDKIKREDFEMMVQPLVDKLTEKLKKIQESLSTYGTLHSFELVGGNTRVPCVIKAAEDVFGMTHSRTLNSDECISEGAAIASAMESPM